MSTNNQLVPYVIEKGDRGERSYDIYSRLLEDRIVFLTGKVDMGSANTIVAQLLYLESVDKEKDISFFINSPGGVITAGLAIYDTMQHIQPDVSTICVGMAASMGSVLLSGGQKGKRYVLPHSQVMIHQPNISGLGPSTASDIEIHAEEMVKNRKTLAKILAENSGQDLDKVMEDIDRDFWLHGEESVDYGIVDEVMTTKELTEKSSDQS